ncbi:hypothetical protein BDD12DRAFT_174336 [Trichophaea hybrida]|nr:hypothetical protein BDD12DRAFT_174336 [Trichophaea hybrida]
MRWLRCQHTCVSSLCAASTAIGSACYVTLHHHFMRTRNCGESSIRYYRLPITFRLRFLRCKIREQQLASVVTTFALKCGMFCIAE